MLNLFLKYRLNLFFDMWSLTLPVQNVTIFLLIPISSCKYTTHDVLYLKSYAQHTLKLKRLVLCWAKARCNMVIKCLRFLTKMWKDACRDLHVLLILLSLLKLGFIIPLKVFVIGAAMHVMSTKNKKTRALLKVIASVD